MSARRVVVGGALLAALAITTPASAQVPTLPLEVRGVRVQSTGPGAVEITFTRAATRLYRRVAGRSLIVSCQRVDVGTGPLLLREDTTSELERTIPAPSRRRPIRLRQRGSSARFDVCKLVGGQFRGTRRNPRFVRAFSIEVPATQTGALFLRERNLGDRMVAALDLVAANGRDGRYPTFSAVADVIPHLVELPSPDATPAPGALGLYSDGAQHVTVAAVTLLGSRLFIDVNGEILSSNVPEVVAGRGD